MAKTEKKQFKEDFLEATVNLYKEIGEPVPYGIIAEIKYSRKVINAGLKELFEDKKLVVMSNPYNTDEDFIGLYDKKYPRNSIELALFRDYAKAHGVTEARKAFLSENE